MKGEYVSVSGMEWNVWDLCVYFFKVVKMSKVYKWKSGPGYTRSDVCFYFVLIGLIKGYKKW